MTKAEKHKRYVDAAVAFVENLPAEYIDHIIDNEDYVLQVIKPIEKMNAGWGLSANRVLEIENLAIEQMNKYHTAMIRQELKKLKAE